MVETVLLVGIVASIFVGFNIGGSSTGIAGARCGCRSPQQGVRGRTDDILRFSWGWTVGRNVMDTLSGDIITIEITLAAGVAVLFSSDWGFSSRTSSAFPSRRR